MNRGIVALGICGHSKSKRYRVLGVVRYSETLEEFVVYEPLYDNKVSKFWTRPLAMFLEKVELEGRAVPRFRYLGE